MSKPISISLSPNTEKDDVLLTLKVIFQPWKWKKGKAILEIENQFKNYLGVKYAVSFNSGRSALLAILKSLNMEYSRGLTPAQLTGVRPLQMEVLLQAFTCVAAVNPILWSDLKPVYVDCSETDFNLNISDLKAKLALRQAQGKTPRVLMVQHTFGLPCNMTEIMAIVRQNNLILIEDCAHALGAEFYPVKSREAGAPSEQFNRVKGQKVGTFGKAGFFSFSRDKIISSVYGGIAVTNNDKIGKSLLKSQKDFGYPTCFWIFQQLLHPVLMNYLILPLYNVLDLGKIFLVLSQWLGILSKAVHWKEKRGKKPSYFPKRLPNALAILALNQFKKLNRFYNHRKKIADFYYQELKNTSFELPKEFPDRKNVFLRFTIKHPKAHEIIYQAWHKANILVGDWYVSPIIPYDTKLESVEYKMGSCPTAEKLSKTTLNLPTHINISKKDAQKIVDFLKSI